MNKLAVITLFVFCFIPFNSSAQETKADTVYLFGGKKMFVDVKKISRDSIIYTETGQRKLKKISKDSVRRIEYDFGKVETLNTRPPVKNTKMDWRKVKVIYDKSQATGLTEVEKITATAKGSGRGYETPKTLRRKAIVILRKKAANLNANYVLIINESISAAFGDIPSATYEGVAYTEDSMQ